MNSNSKNIKMSELLTHNKRFIGPFTVKELIYVTTSSLIVLYLYLFSDLPFVTKTVFSLVVISFSVVFIIIHPENLFVRLRWRGIKEFEHVLIASSPNDEVFSELQRFYNAPAFSIAFEEKPLDESIKLLELEIKNLKVMLGNLESEKKLVPAALKYKIGDTEKNLEKVKSGSLKIFEVTVKVDTKQVSYKEAREAHKKAMKLVAGHY